MAGLVMACPVARNLLQTGQSPSGGPFDVVITEGEPDFLTHATRSEGSAAPAVVGDRKRTPERDRTWAS